MFAGAATRRHQGAPELGASFPFTVRPTGAGWGGISDSDEENARAEFWAPLWGQPAGHRELEGLLREGRAVLNGKTARDGFGFCTGSRKPRNEPWGEWVCAVWLCDAVG